MGPPVDTGNKWSSSDIKGGVETAQGDSKPIYHQNGWQNWRDDEAASSLQVNNYVRRHSTFRVVGETLCRRN